MELTQLKWTHVKFGFPNRKHYKKKTGKMAQLHAVKKTSFDYTVMENFCTRIMLNIRIATGLFSGFFTQRLGNLKQQYRMKSKLAY